ncbi:potassium channel family protein [Psychromonas antarctica]|jgi:voltage-gated potassium channel|uniref:potassium channel family protein n=1 Tax=Psychromonas antarctica TaxID=67573 RepID=UPI001EE7F4A1|nr:potassium channel family protein [Psychromonas antarctica]MCG6201629.1 potassium channel family protein [Psychromonas antarctica]
MLFSQKLKKKLRRLTQQLTWPTMFFLVIAQTIATYLLLIMADESALTDNPLQFIYYNMVVVSTVGFGDFSPITPLGKMIVSIFQIPSGLIIFATFIGKITQLFINIARSNMNGENDFYHLEDHILLLCWDPYSTEQIIALILGDKKRQKRQILLCVTDDMKNPFPGNDEVSFVRLRTFSDKEELKRIALSSARRIIIDGKSDDETLSIALSIATYANIDANISAHFVDKSKAELLKIHCPQIECSIDSGAQMMVRSMQDPGSSQVTAHLLSTLNGATLYCLQTPKLDSTVNFDLLFNMLKKNHGMILIALSHFKNGDDMTLNPDPSSEVKSGDFLHYIANERVDTNEINWQSFC